MTDEIKFYPELRSIFVADDGRKFDLPIAFEWFDKHKLWKRLFKGEALKAKQCRDLWKWIGRTDSPPKTLNIYVNNKDLDRLLAKYKPAK